MGVIWSLFYPREDLASKQRHREQQLVIQEIQSMEACVYCYLDKRLEILLLPYASKTYPWDKSCDILPHFRGRADSQSKNCYHCTKGSLVDHFTCKIIDQIYSKNTQKCQCELRSKESSEISLGPFDGESDDDEDENSDVDDGEDENSDFEEAVSDYSNDSDYLNYSDDSAYLNYTNDYANLILWD